MQMANRMSPTTHREGGRGSMAWAKTKIEKKKQKKWTNTNSIVKMFICCCGLSLGWNLLNISIKMHIKLRQYCWYCCCYCSLFFNVTLSIYVSVKSVLSSRSFTWNLNRSYFFHSWIVYSFFICAAVISIFNCYYYYYECTVYTFLIFSAFEY